MVFVHRTLSSFLYDSFGGGDECFGIRKYLCVWVNHYPFRFSSFINGVNGECGTIRKLNSVEKVVPYAVYLCVYGFPVITEADNLYSVHAFPEERLNLSGK